MIVRTLTLACVLAQIPMAATAADSYRPLQLEGFQLKWGLPELGTPATVTYALVDQPVSSFETINCGQMQPIGPMLTKNGISADEFRLELLAAFEAWSDVAAVTFAPAGSAEEADILIGAQTFPRGWAFTNVDFDAAEAAGPTATLSRSLICFNPEKPWKVGFDGDLKVYDLRYVLGHEIGHAIGLNHPLNRATMMHHNYKEDFREPQSGDVAGITSIYGPHGLGTAVDSGGEANVLTELAIDPASEDMSGAE